MVQGTFVENLPFIQVVIISGQSVQAPVVVLDTGFTGDLKVTPKIAKELGLEPLAVAKVEKADGKKEGVSAALAVASMEGVNNHVQVLISERLPLAGISFLSKFDYNIRQL